MISHDLGHTAEIQGLILIDCWEPPSWKSQTVDVYNQLATKFESWPFQEVINASNKLAFDYKDPSITNTLKTYLWDTTSGFYNANPRLVLNAVYNFQYEYKTFPGFRDGIMRQVNSYYITDHDDFLRHWERNGRNRITNWLVIGSQWQNCVHNNSIGLHSMANLTKNYNLNFYGCEGGFVTEDARAVTQEDYKKDSLTWQQCDHGLYKLVLGQQ